VELLSDDDVTVKAQKIITMFKKREGIIVGFKSPYATEELKKPC
jgi:hypothetical protein